MNQRKLIKERIWIESIFLKSVLLTTGGVLLGGTTIYRCLNSKETTDTSLPSLIDKTHQGKYEKDTCNN